MDTKVIELKKQISDAHNTISKAQQELELYQKNCKHTELKVSDSGSVAECAHCEKKFFWYCPTSPTKTCCYEQEDGSYDEDSCIYCGEPEERK